MHCRTTYFYDPGQHKDDIPKTLIVNVVTSLDVNGSWTNPFDVPIDFEFTEFMNESEIDELKNKNYSATLKGFIQHFPGHAIQNEKGEDAFFNEHYVSITKSLFPKDYFFR